MLPHAKSFGVSYSQNPSLTIFVEDIHGDNVLGKRKNLLNFPFRVSLHFCFLRSECIDVHAARLQASSQREVSRF